MNMEDENMITLITNSPLFLLFADVLLYIIENRNLIEIVFQYKKSYWTERLDSSPGLPWPEEPRDDMEDGTKNGLRFTSLYIVIHI